MHLPPPIVPRFQTGSCCRRGCPAAGRRAASRSNCRRLLASLEVEEGAHLPRRSPRLATRQVVTGGLRLRVWLPGSLNSSPGNQGGHRGRGCSNGSVVQGDQLGAVRAQVASICTFVIQLRDPLHHLSRRQARVVPSLISSATDLADPAPPPSTLSSGQRHRFWVVEAQAPQASGGLRQQGSRDDGACSFSWGVRCMGGKTDQRHSGSGRASGQDSAGTFRRLTG